MYVADCDRDRDSDATYALCRRYLMYASPFDDRDHDRDRDRYLQLHQQDPVALAREAGLKVTEDKSMLFGGVLRRIVCVK